MRLKRPAERRQPIVNVPLLATVAMLGLLAVSIFYCCGEPIAAWAALVRRLMAD